MVSTMTYLSVVRRKRKTVKRIVSPQMIKRASSTETPLLLGWLDTTVMALGVATDKWRFHKGEPEEVSMCMDAFYAIWSELQARGI